jgi:predicted phosphoribosyltransferase
MFLDRTDAGIQLAEKLRKYQKESGVVLAIPKGGVPVAFEVARELGFPTEVILTKKIGHPLHKEYAIGAASLTDYFVIPHDHVTEAYVEAELKKIRARLKEMYKNYMGDIQPENIEGKTVIVIDDGIATGNTLLATVNILRKGKPKKIIIGAPVASRSAFEKLSNVVDEVIVVLIPDQFYGVGAFYENFGDVSDEEVMYYLGKLRDLRKAG